MVSVHTRGRRRGQALRGHIIKNRYLYLMLVPVLAWYLVFCYLPMYGAVMAFQKYSFTKGVFSPFVGFDNFVKIFSQADIHKAILNTFIINLMRIAVGMPVPILFALLLNELRSVKYKRIVQTVTYLPHFISWVSLAGIIFSLFTVEIGAVNLLLKQLGLKQVDFLTSNRFFRWFLVLTDIWKGFGWGSIIYLAAIAGIDSAMYEASVIDGANRWHKAVYITLPCISNTFVIMLILTLGNITSGNLDQIYNLYSPLTYETADTIDTFLLRRLMTRPEMGQLAAAEFAKSVVKLIMLVAANKTAISMGHEGIYSDYKGGAVR